MRTSLQADRPFESAHEKDSQDDLTVKKSERPTISNSGGRIGRNGHGGSGGGQYGQYPTFGLDQT